MKSDWKLWLGIGGGLWFLGKIAKPARDDEASMFAALGASAAEIKAHLGKSEDQQIAEAAASEAVFLQMSWLKGKLLRMIDVDAIRETLKDVPKWPFAVLSAMAALWAIDRKAAKDVLGKNYNYAARKIGENAVLASIAKEQSLVRKIQNGIRALPEALQREFAAKCAERVMPLFSADKKMNDAAYELLNGIKKNIDGELSDDALFKLEHEFRVKLLKNRVFSPVSMFEAGRVLLFAATTKYSLARLKTTGEASYAEMMKLIAKIDASHAAAKRLAEGKAPKGASSAERKAAKRLAEKEAKALADEAAIKAQKNFAEDVIDILKKL